MSHSPLWSLRRALKANYPNTTHWNGRILADTLVIDKSMVQRVWQASGRSTPFGTFKVSRDEKFIEKVVDVVACSYLTLIRGKLPGSLFE